MSVLKVGEIGKILQVGSSFDLSANTDLKLEFTKPDQTTLIVDKAGGVSAPITGTTVDVNGVATTFDANEYWQYATSSGDLDQPGTWVLNGVYIDATPKEFCGDSFTFLVLPC